jgi:NADH-quinone oxidoreductase subunit G
MVVHTQNEKVAKGRESVLEFLLINHPLDCPVCDQSGECDLQNFYMTYGLYDSRFQEQKQKKAKALPLGPTIMLDAERCVLCSRCTRFTDEITKTGELGIFNRGDKAEVGLYPGKVLNNNYSGNVADICPVGALTDRDFRFKARVWYLSSAPSVCTGCSQGCNTDLHYVTDRPHLADGARVMRVKPRVNPDVNQWWMCDEGRYGYKFIDENRAKQVTHRGREYSWEKALHELGTALNRLKADKKQASAAVIPSAQQTNEELYLVRKLFKEGLGIANCDITVPKQPGTADNWLLKADKNPNTLGATLLGFPGKSAPLPDIKALWVFGHDLVKLYGEEKVKQLADTLDLFVFQGSTLNGTAKYAHYVLPSAVYAENDGTFVNCHGRVQRIKPAFSPIAAAWPDWQVLLHLFELLEIPSEFSSPQQIFAKIAAENPAFAGLSYDVIGMQGAPVKAGVEAAAR